MYWSTDELIATPWQAMVIDCTWTITITLLECVQYTAARTLNDRPHSVFVFFTYFCLHCFILTYFDYLLFILSFIKFSFVVEMSGVRHML